MNASGVLCGHITQASTSGHAPSCLKKIHAGSSRLGQKSLRSRRDHYCQTEVSDGALMSTIFGTTDLQDEGGGSVATSH